MVADKYQGDRVVKLCEEEVVKANYILSKAIAIDYMIEGERRSSHAFVNKAIDGMLRNQPITLDGNSPKLNSGLTPEVVEQIVTPDAVLVVAGQNIFVNKCKLNQLIHIEPTNWH